MKKILSILAGVAALSMLSFTGASAGGMSGNSYSPAKNFSKMMHRPHYGGHKKVVIVVVKHKKKFGRHGGKYKLIKKIKRLHRLKKRLRRAEGYKRHKLLRKIKRLKRKIRVTKRRKFRPHQRRCRPATYKIVRIKHVKRYRPRHEGPQNGGFKNRGNKNGGLRRGRKGTPA